MKRRFSFLRWFRIPVLILFILLNLSSLMYAGSTTYIYDDLYRLVKVIYPDGTTTTYTYDAVGNMLSVATVK